MPPSDEPPSDEPPSDEFVPKPCPWCTRSGGLTIGVRLLAQPIGTWSLAGAQLKTSARQRAALSCSECTSYALGYIDDDGDFRAEQVFDNSTADRDGEETP